MRDAHRYDVLVDGSRVRFVVYADVDLGVALVARAAAVEGGVYLSLIGADGRPELVTLRGRVEIRKAR